MKRYKLFLVALCCIGLLNAKVLLVRDVSDKEPLPGATVFSQSGIILGMTDGNGNIDISNPKDYPVSVTCIGYETGFATSLSDAVDMQPKAFELSEFTVSTEERPVTRIVCYVREYLSGATSSDTIMHFNEHMADMFLTDRKVKGFKPQRTPRFLTSRLYVHEFDSLGRDTIYCAPYRDDTLAWEGLISFPEGRKEFSEKILQGATIDTVPGKYSIAQMIRRQGPLVSVATDYLSAYKEHKFSPFIFKLLGLTIDMTQLSSNLVVNPSDSLGYSARDLVSATFNFEILARGKWFKKIFKTDSPVLMQSFYEIYPVDIQNLTVEEAKQLRRSYPKQPFIESEYANPLPASVLHLINVAKANKQAD